MKAIQLTLCLVLFAVATKATSQSSDSCDIFISEYAEGSSNNKYLEIYNPTSEAIALSDYAIAAVGNAPTTLGVHEYWNTFSDGATIAAGDVYVWANGGSGAEIIAETDQTGNAYFNGDDGYALVFGTQEDYTFIDIVGNFEGDPGFGWEVAGTSNATANHTLVRKGVVNSGVGYDWATAAGTNEFDSQWIVYNQDTWNYLGSHSTSGCGDGGGGGCILDNACNFDPAATTDDGSCIFTCQGCTDSSACNYVDWATEDDGSCSYPEDSFGESYFDCSGQCLNDSDADGICDETEVDGVTFQVDMSGEDYTGYVFLFSEFDEFALPGSQMEDSDGDDIYTLTVENLEAGEWLYRFYVDDCFDESNGLDPFCWQFENIDQNAVCAGWVDETYIQRVLYYDGGDLILEPVCWESCEACNDVAIDIDVEFQVDLNGIDASYDQVYVSGSFDGWCGECNEMTDPDGNGIFSVTIPMESNSFFEYKFLLDDWEGMEQLQAGPNCFVENNSFVNRALNTLQEDMILPAVCWESCEACVGDSPGCDWAGNFCYLSSAQFVSYGYAVAPAGQSIFLLINSGQIEDYWDQIYVYDGLDLATSNILWSTGFTSVAGNQDLSGTFIESPTGVVNIVMDSDGSGSCADSGYTPIDWVASCLFTGCLDTAASNFDPYATEDDGSCEYLGCTDSTACNFDPAAQIDDESCAFESVAVTINPNPYSDSENYWELYDAQGTVVANGTYISTDICLQDACYTFTMFDLWGDGMCCEYGPGGYNLTDDNGQTLAEGGEFGSSESTPFCLPSNLGCMDVNACNFDNQANTDDGSCFWQDSYVDCEGNCFTDTDEDGTCDELEVTGCTEPMACNYFEEATDDDGSCDYSCQCQDESACNYGSAMDIESLAVLIELWDFNFEVEMPGLWYYDTTECCQYFYGGTSPDLQLINTSDTTYWTFYPGEVPFGYQGNLWVTLMDEDGGEVLFTDSLDISFGSTDTLSFYVEDYIQACSYPEIGYDCEGNCIDDTDSDGICDLNEVFGCTEIGACNYEPTATEEDGSCFYAEDFRNCEGFCLNDYDQDDVCDEFEITTCDNPLACNFGATIATAEEIQVIIFGINSNVLVDNSWTVEFEGEVFESGFPGEVSFITTSVDSCMELSFNIDWEFFEGTFDVILVGEGSIGTEFYLSESFEINGLTSYTICITDYLTACEFPEFALDCAGSCMNDMDNDGICDEFEISGCTEPLACNFSSEATNDDGSCFYTDPGYNCDGVCDDFDADGVCDVDEIIGCTIAAACNFNPLATQENGTCYFSDEFEDCDGNCNWESVATGNCGELAGLACDDYAFAISPGSGGCSTAKTAYILDDGSVQTGFWTSEYDMSGLTDAAAIFTEPNDGQLAWIDWEGLTWGVGSCNELVVPTMGNALKIDLEHNHGVILRANGTVASFAPESAYDALEQTPIIFNYFVLDACAGADFNLAVDGSQNILYWGIPDFVLQNDYAEVPHAGGFVQVDAYGHVAAAVTEYGELVIWGDDSNGLVSAAPNAVSDAVSVALGDGFGVVLHENGDITQWTTNASMPAPPSGLGNIIDITTSKDQVLAQVVDGTFASWGIQNTPEAPLEFTALGDIEVALDLCIHGCTSPDFHNYDPTATEDDGTCNNIGCMVEEALNYEPWATEDDGSCIILGCTEASACNYNPDAQYGIRIDAITEHTGLVGTTDLTGFTTYHVVLTGPSTTDRLSAVMGDANSPLVWSVNDGIIWQETIAGNVIPSINTNFISFIPELEFDSWVTIGVDPYSYNPSEQITVVESLEQPWITEFEGGSGITMNDEYGGAWFVAGAESTGIFGEDHDVLLAQITTNGELSIESMNIQILPSTFAADDVRLFYEADVHACAYNDGLVDCNGNCINDSDADGVCDENEIPGCTNGLACNFDAEATDDDGTCLVYEDEIQLVVETITTHDELGELNGRSTYRVYAEMHNSDERISAVVGFDEHPLLIEQGNGLIYQHAVGGPTPSPLSPAVLSLFPEAAFDSYVALGRGHEDLPTAVQILTGSEEWASFFELGLPVDIASVTGGGWFSTDINDGLPIGDDHRVLLGQFTTLGGLQGQVSIQYFDCNGFEQVVYDLIFTSENNSAGCMDISACNYNPEATIDDESCCFASCATVSGYASVDLVDLIGENDPEIINTSEAGGITSFNYCLTTSCYQVSGTAPIQVLASWNGADVSADVQGFGILGSPASPCVGCTDDSACNYEATTIYNDESCEHLAGDFNGDLATTVEDMLLLLSEYNNCDLPDECATDINGSGYVSVDDLLLFLSYFGNSCDD